MHTTFPSVPSFLEIIDRKCCILFGPPCIEVVHYQFHTWRNMGVLREFSQSSRKLLQRHVYFERNKTKSIDGTSLLVIAITKYDFARNEIYR